METLEHIPVTLDPEQIKRKLHLKREGQWRHIEALVEEAQFLIRARAVYKACYIESRPENVIVIDGNELKSRVLCRNLEGVERVFPYVVTLGDNIEERARGCSDLLEQYYLDTIGNAALTAARTYLRDRLKSKYALDGMSLMSPGSLKDWDLKEQRLLFSILGDVEAAIGVRLTETFLMLPKKSVSGIYFPTEVPFFSCQLCSRERCPSRKAKYSETLAREYGMLD